jgi:hypothetical protein
MRYFPRGDVREHGVRRAIAPEAREVERESGARANAWGARRVADPLSASTVTTALSNDDSLGCPRRVLHTISTMRRPVNDAIAWRESGGDGRKPGRTKPSASAALVIVDAVPIVMQWPGDRAMPFSMPVHSACVMFPQRSSAQYFHVSEPLPRTTPFQSPRSIGPAGR